VIVNSAAVVEHDVLLGEFSHVSPNATLAGGARVGPMAQIGAGATVLPGKSIGARSIVGAGSVVTKDVSSDCVVAGVPAREIQQLRG
jgi:acetyltransferase EpsM